MASRLQLKINGILIKNPDRFKVSSYNLTKAGRVSSGKMKLDLVAKKVKLFLEYDVISGRDLKQILDLIDGEELFFTASYVDNMDIERSYTCYVGEIPRDLFRTGGIADGWYWKNANFNLIEQ